MTCDECGKHWIIRSCPCCGTDDRDLTIPRYVKRQAIRRDDDDRNDDREYEERDDRIDFDTEDFRWM